MSTIDGEVPISVSRPLRERLVAVFKFSRWFPKGSSRRCEKKRSTRSAKTDSTGAQKKTRSCSNGQFAKKVKENVQQPQKKQTQTTQELHPNLLITSISNPHVPTRAKIANYEPPKPYTSRRIGSLPAASSRNYSGPMYSSAGSVRYNSGIRSVPVSGELTRGGSVGPKIIRSSSRSLSKLRDNYVRAMMKLGDMADSVAMGTSVNVESQLFESEVIRKRSQANNDIMDYYFNSSIQPDEWKDARMGSRVIRNGAISV